MRVLFVHNRYQQRGGEDRVVEAESRLLARVGHEVELWEESNDSIVGLAAACRTAMEGVYSMSHARQMSERIRRFRPDVVHIHNFFPRFSPAIHVVCHGAGVPVIQTLHNFRLLCPAATFHGKGGLCEECLREPLFWPSLLRGCYRDSRLATLAVANMLSVHRCLGTWGRCVSRFIALTECARAKFIEGGIAGEKITVKPNFVDPDPGPGMGDGDFALFVGRLTEEKGIRTLLGAWNRLGRGPKLKIIGEGPLSPLVERASRTNANVEWLGQCDPKTVAHAMAEATVLILPSTWFEAFPLVIAEAFAAGLPILASRIGAMEEVVADGQTGRLFAAGNADELAEMVLWAFSHPEDLRRMRRSARAAFEEKYTARVNYARLMEVYEAALGTGSAAADAALPRPRGQQRCASA